VRIFLPVFALLAFFSLVSLVGDDPPKTLEMEMEPLAIHSLDCRPLCPPQATPTPPPCPACSQDENTWRHYTAKPPPQLLGQTAALIDASCERMIYGLRAHEQRLPASLVKVATAMAVVEKGKLTDVVPITIDGWALSARDGSSIMGLEVGMRLTVEDLLYGLMLPSGNDAALALADHLGGEARLVAAMNDKVKQLGLGNTKFSNTHGLDVDGAYSSAFDMTILGRELLKNELLKKIVNSRFITTSWSANGLWNGNYLLYIYKDAIGVKTGWTEGAGGTIIAAAERDGRLLVASVMHSADVFWDTMRLFDWTFDNIPSTC
jgi:serine-type D-Ala-D-Ala carboxypeptidase (penicillin-binding protein 5/6)